MSSIGFSCTCGASTQIYDSRLVHEPSLTYRWRRHLCQQGHRFTTYEIVKEEIERLRSEVAALNSVRKVLVPAAA